jgi:hypothetical protein
MRGGARPPTPRSCAVIHSILSFTRFISGIINTQCSDNIILRCVYVRPRTHFSRGKAITITYCECVSVVLVIEHATRMRHSHLWPVWRHRIFHILS